MREPPPISVVIPSFNAAAFLPTTIRSVLAQHGFALEVLVVDDGSSDGTASMLATEFPQVRVIEQANQGVAVARNTGLEFASHEWVALIDADDVWLPGKLQAQVDLLSMHPDAHMCYSAWHVWPTSEVEPPFDLIKFLVDAGADQNAARRWDGPSGWIYPELLIDCEVWTSTVLARRGLLLELGGFDSMLRVGEDYDLWLRASRQTQILRVCKPLALYRHHGQNITHRVPDRNHKGEVIGRALARWGYVGPDGRCADRGRVNAGLARSWADFAGALLEGGRPKAARSAARSALAIDLGQRQAWKVLTKSLLASAGAK